MNEGDQAVHFIYLLGVLVLVASGLVVRRIPIAQGLKMFVGWVLIFGVAFVVFTLKDEFLALGNRVLVETRGGVEQVAPGEIRIRQAPDGHFWVTAEVNGEPVRFLRAPEAVLDRENQGFASLEAAGGEAVTGPPGE